MKYMRLGGLALAATMLGIVGCGGGSPATLTSSQLIAKADPICEKSNAELHKALLVPKWKSLPGPAAYFATYERRASAEMAGLRAPMALASDWRAIVLSYRQLGEDMAKLGAEAKVRPKPDIRFAAQMIKMQHERAVIARRNGFTSCSQY